MSTIEKPTSTITDAYLYEEVTYAAAELYNRGDYEAAIERLEEMKRVNPNNIKVHEVLADAYLRGGRVDLADREMSTIRELASRLYPHISVGPQRSFEELAAQAAGSGELESRYVQLLKAGSAEELARNTDVAAQLSVKLMARDEYAKAEKVLARYSERLVVLRESVS